MVFDRKANHSPTIAVDGDMLECVIEFVYFGEVWSQRTMTAVQKLAVE